ncbi:hypothetical protein [Algoriphagus sp.]|uniref:hypothetical protein n=1 Tax=Algoriphagus sp. TaxID=1872435 RepID=UPI00391DE915
MPKLICLKLYLNYSAFCLLLLSCSKSEIEIKKLNLGFEVSLSPYATVTDMEIGNDNIFLLTNKHEILIYDHEGGLLFDTLFASPRLYPNGAVEVYLNNSFNSIFYFENALYSLGVNPSDMYRFDLKTKKFSKKQIELSESGMHTIMSTNYNELIVSFRNPQKGIFQIFKIDFPEMKSSLLSEVTQTTGSKTTFSSFTYQDELYLIDGRGEGLLQFEHDRFSKVRGNFFLDSILFKGELKGIQNLTEYASLEPWEQNQYQPDRILSGLKVNEKEFFFLVKILNRTDPDTRESEMILFKQTGDELSRKTLVEFQFAKLDQETKSFLGFNEANRAIVISNLDSLVNSD